MRRIAPIRGVEWAVPVCLAVVFILLGCLPYWVGYATAPEGETFMGFVGRGTPGANSYFAFARQVAEGHHTVTNLYTPDAPERAYFNLEWWLMGQAARLTGLSLPTLFHIGRVLTVLAFILATYYFAATSLRAPRQRVAVLFLITCGTGVGWLIYGANALFGTSLALSLDAQGVNLFGYLVNKPHFIRAGVFAALQYAWLIRADQTGRTQFFALSGLAATGHSLVRPYHIPESLLVLILYGALRVWGHPARRRQIASQVLLCAACHAPAILWHTFVFLRTPLGLGPLDAWTPIFLLPQVLWLGLPFGALLLYAIARLARGRATAFSCMPVPAIWLVAAFLLLQCHPYFRWGVESYFAWVLAPPLLFVRYVWPRLEALRRTMQWPRKARAVAYAAIVLTVFPGCLLTYGKFFTDLRHPDTPWQYYLHDDTIAAITWLGDREHDRKVLLASHDTSQFVPRLADVRVVTGQDVLSANYRQHNRWVTRFFQSPGDDGYKQWLCHHLGVTHVLYGPFERQIARQDLEKHPWLEPVHQEGETTLYAVRLP